MSSLHASELRSQMMLLVRRLRRETQSSDIPPSHLMLLGRIELLNNDATPSELADSEAIRPQNLSAMLRTLEQDGLICRRQDPRDKRKTRVSMTREGRQLLHAERADRDSWLEQAMHASLSDEEKALLARAGRLLQRLASHEDRRLSA